MEGISLRTEAAHVDADEYYYQEYVAVLQGEITAEKTEYLASERETFDELTEEFGRVQEKMEAGEISESYGDYLLYEISHKRLRKTAFERVEEQYLYLLSQREAGIPVTFFSDTGFRRLLQNDTRTAFDVGVLCFVLCLAMAGFYPMEETSHVAELIVPSALGKQSVLMAKIKALLLYSAIAAVCSMLPYLVYVFRNYTFSGWDESARSLMFFANAPAGIPLLVWVIALYLVRVAGAMLAAVAIFLISLKIKRTIPTVILTLVLFELPVLLYFLL